MQENFNNPFIFILGRIAIGVPNLSNCYKLCSNPLFFAVGVPKNFISIVSGGHVDGIHPLAFEFSY